MELDPNSAHQTHALHLLQAFAAGTPESLTSILTTRFTPSAKFYMWGPHEPPMSGTTEMLEGFKLMFAQLKDFRYRIKTVAEKGNFLFIERFERFRYMDKHDVEVYLVSVSEVGADGKIVEWKDYFDPGIITGLS